MHAPGYFNRETDILELLFLDVVADYSLRDEYVKEGATSVRDELHDRPWQKTPSYEGIDFNDLFKCLGYVKRYAACHCALARHSALLFFHNVPDSLSLELLNRPVLNVVSVGGGPGNDLVGFCSALYRHPRRNFYELELTVVDLKHGWNDVFKHVMQRISTYDYGMISRLFREVEVDTSFVLDDVAQYSWNTAAIGAYAVKSADIVLMTKVLSVLSVEQKGSMLRRIFAAMKYRAIFLFVDIDAGVVLKNAGPDMEILMYPTPRQIFSFSPMDKDAIYQCNYEICALRKII